MGGGVSLISISLLHLRDNFAVWPALLVQSLHMGGTTIQFQSNDAVLATTEPWALLPAESAPISALTCAARFCTIPLRCIVPVQTHSNLEVGEVLKQALFG